MTDIVHTVFEFFRETGFLYLEMAPYLLLGLTVSGILSVVMSKKFVAHHTGKPGFGAVLKASLLGVPLPLCSCGVVPTAAYLRNAGASRPAVMSFLISTPQTGVDSIAATYGMLGPLFAVFRPLIALVTGIAGGLVSAFSLRREPVAEPAGTSDPSGAADHADPGGPRDPVRTIGGKIRAAISYGYGEAIDDIAVHFIVGLAIAGLISMLIPDDFFTGTILGHGFPAMVLMVLVGIPMYVCSTSSIPIAVALIAKGLSPGAAYVFLVAGPATNAATLTVLLRVLGRRQTMIYVGTIVAGSLVFGPVMDWLTRITGWVAPEMGAMVHEGALSATVQWGASAVFTILLLAALWRRWVPKRAAPPATEVRDGVAVTRLAITGMTCHHCVANVESALSSVAGVGSVHVDLKRGEAVIHGPAEIASLSQAVVSAGYALKG